MSVRATVRFTRISLARRVQRNERVAAMEAAPIGGFPMPTRLIRRLVGGLAAVCGLWFVLAGFAGPASAHDVTNITANCDTVTVFFTGFPESGVTVHIAATVQGHGSASTDVFVNNTTTSATLNIASATDDMFGATANVDVDVTWTFQGPQHVHDMASVTCGEATTTTTTQPATTTTTAPATTTTTTTIAGESTTTTTVVGVQGETTSTTAATAVVSAGEATNGPTTGGAVVSPAATGTSGGSSSLPFTGSATAPLALTGLTALAAGAGLWATQRRKSHI
jgi:hypothetical protein